MYVRKIFSEVIKDYLSAGVGGGGRTVTLTSDSWTSEAQSSFNATTLHFIDDSWDLYS